MRLCALAALGLLLLPGCSKKKPPEPVVTVQSAIVRRTTLNLTVATEAVLYPLHQATLSPKITAPIAKFYVNRGSRVHRGELVAMLENKDLKGTEVENKGAYEQAQAQYANATAATVPQEMQKAESDVTVAKRALEAQEKVYASREQLFREGALPRKELDQSGVDLVKARNDYELASRYLKALQSGAKEQQLKAASGQLTAAEGKYLSSKAMLAYSEIRSPLNGVVTDRPLYPGDMATAGQPLMTIMDLSQVVARAHIPQPQAALLKISDKATLTVSGTNEEVPAKVTLVSPALDPNSTTVEIWVRAANPNLDLRPGSTVQLTIVAETVPDALAVPAESVIKISSGGQAVMLVGTDGRAHQQPVQLGIRQGDEVQITSGLREGERVVTSGAYGLPDNTRVKLAQSGAPTGEAKSSPDSGKKP
jgi:HlyD family secretion protein